MPQAHRANLVLIGLRGSGKTTVGRAVAAEVGARFIDLDRAVVAAAGCDTVQGIFESRGEEGFRALEAEALRAALAAEHGAVLALGGGTPTAPGAADLLREAKARGAAVIAYLRAPAAALRERLATGDNAHRPSLTGRGVLEEIEELFARRDGLYRSLADAVVEVERLTERQVCERVREAWQAGSSAG